MAQILALMPRLVITDQVHLPESTLDNLPKYKTYLKPRNTNLTALASDPDGTAAYKSSLTLYHKDLNLASLLP